MAVQFCGRSPREPTFLKFYLNASIKCHYQNPFPLWNGRCELGNCKSWLVWNALHLSQISFTLPWTWRRTCSKTPEVKQRFLNSNLGFHLLFLICDFCKLLSGNSTPSQTTIRQMLRNVNKWYQINNLLAKRSLSTISSTFQIHEGGYH
jgi:hypothetical protein